MNATIVANWNAVVRTDDQGFILGDVMLGKNFEEHLPLLDELNGRLTLVVGNHDRMFGKMSLEKRRRWETAYSNHFDDIWEFGGVEIGGQRFFLSHFPYDGDTYDGKEDRYQDARLLDGGTPLIHGHTHQNKRISRSKTGTLQIHVGQDAWGFHPVDENVILDIWEQNS